MDMVVHGTTSEALVEHVNARLGAALDQFEMRVNSVTVKLEDVNGPSKGHDKRCLVTVKVMRDGPLVIDEIDDDMYAAVSKAADRVKNAMSRKHSRRIDNLHGH